MTSRSPQFIQQWLDRNLYRFDGPGQYLGDEPGSVRRDWDSATVRWLMAASWPYQQASGNTSIPAIYRSILDADPHYACERFYLPATPRDLTLLERGGIPVFGIESKHQLRDFDVVGTSISYTVLFMNFCKELSVSGVPVRRQAREQRPGEYPMVCIGGHATSAPEFMSPVADCFWLGDAEDEPGNPGIGAVCERIAAFKTSGAWHSDRRSCYDELAREFPFLYFPHTVSFRYRYEDRGLPQPVKMVAGYESILPGVKPSFRSRVIRNLDNVTLLDEPPLLYTGWGMGGGDIEVGKGCPAWCSFPLLGVEEIVTRGGIRPIEETVGDEDLEVWTGKAWAKAVAESHGWQPLQRVIFRPADQGTVSGAWRRTPRAVRRVEVVATPAHGWGLVDGSETHQLKVGDIVPAGAADEEGPDFDAGWVHGFLFGDGHQRHFSTGERRPVASGTFKVRLFGKDIAALPRFERFLASGQDDRNSWAQRPPLRVSSIVTPGWAKGDSVVYGWAAFNVKTWPEALSSQSYRSGFLAGWLAADAARGKGVTSKRLSASYLPANHGEISPGEWLARHAAEAGWVYVGSSVSSVQFTNYGQRSAPLVEHTLVKAEGHGWCVESITPLDRTAEVFCLTVPDARRFTLASGIVTGNCRASWIAKPYRQESVPRSIERARRLRLNTGAPAIFPFALDIPFHTAKKELFGGLLEQVSGEVDASSFRVDDYLNDPDFAMLMSVSGQTGLTLGIEGNSQRMRDLAGKGIADEEIIEAVTRAIRSGINRIKLYMISSWPGEEPQDVMRIVELGKRMAEIRDGLGRPGVQILFSWTPLLLEAQTPMQWFAVTPPDYTLKQAIEELRPYRIRVHIGSKAHPEKLALFQACQRASRDAGEAITDVFEELGTASWGGFDKDMKQRLDAALIRHGFLNGLDDLFGERFEHDLFGWEHIDTGVSRQLMWDTYRRMLEFCVGTSAESYEEQFDEAYRGSEWIARCDERCQGKACGACSREDLELRQQYIAIRDRDLREQPVQRLDHLTVACRLRLKVTKPEGYKFIAAEALADIIRRAAFRACDVTGFPAIAPRTVRLASDGQRFRDRSAGVDYAELGFTVPVTTDGAREFLPFLVRQLRPWLDVPGTTSIAKYPAVPSSAFQVLPADAQMPKNPPSLWELEVSDQPEAVQARLAWWAAQAEVPVLLKSESLYTGVQSEPGDAKHHIRDFWLARSGHRYVLRMVLQGQLGSYQAYAALMGKLGWLEAARHTAMRLAFFGDYGSLSGTLLRPVCITCGFAIPYGLLDEPFDSELCPRCRDEAAGVVAASVPLAGV